MLLIQRGPQKMERFYVSHKQLSLQLQVIYHFDGHYLPFDLIINQNEILLVTVTGKVWI